MHRRMMLRTRYALDSAVSLKQHPRSEKHCSEAAAKMSVARTRGPLPSRRGRWAGACCARRRKQCTGGVAHWRRAACGEPMHSAKKDLYSLSSRTTRRLVLRSRPPARRLTFSRSLNAGTSGAAQSPLASRSTHASPNDVCAAAIGPTPPGAASKAASSGRPPRGSHLRTTTEGRRGMTRPLGPFGAGHAPRPGTKGGAGATWPRPKAVLRRPHEGRWDARGGHEAGLPPLWGHGGARSAPNAARHQPPAEHLTSRKARTTGGPAAPPVHAQSMRTGPTSELAAAVRHRCRNSQRYPAQP